MRILLFFFLVKILVFGEVFNQIDKGYKTTDIEKGWMFYDEDKTKVEENIKVEKGQKVTLEAELLNKLLNEMRNMKNELKLIKYYINPNAPQKVKCEDGTIDWSNSRPECFVMPVITEGRNLPALYNLMQEPSEENAQKWLGVQAKLFNRSTQVGYALHFAFLNGDSKVYPTNTTLSTPLKGTQNASNLFLLKKHLLSKHASKIGTVIFLGNTKGFEKEISPEFLARTIASDSTFLNPLIIFKDIETKTAYDTFYSLKPKKDELRVSYEAAEKRVMPDMFKKYDIKLTPTVMAIYEDKNEVKKSIIAKGEISKETIITSYIQFLIYNNIIEPKQITTDSMWSFDNAKF